jgi:hypothetical protein
MGVESGDIEEWLLELDKAREVREQRSFRYLQWTFWAAVGALVAGGLVSPLSDDG